DVVFVNNVPIVGINPPSSLTPRANLDFSSMRDDNGTGIAVDSSFVYLTASRAIAENGTVGDTRLYIGRYLDVTDDKGVPPTAQITSPTSGQTVIEGQTLTVTVDAADDVAIASVDVLANGQLVFTSTTIPYQAELNVPIGISTLTLGARAIDLGGNIGIASDVILTVIPDPGTTGIGTVVDSEGNPVDHATVKGPGGQTTTTLADGTFSLPGLPTTQGMISLSASAAVGRDLLAGQSRSVPSVPGGVTDLGTISLTAPAVHITAPTPGASLIQGTTAKVRVDVSDAAEIVSVDLLVDGQTIDTSSSTPSRFFLTVPTGVSTLTLGARALDAGGAIGFADEIVVNLIPDPGTTAVGTVVDEAGNPIGGAAVTIETGISIELIARRPLPKTAGPPPPGSPGLTGTTEPDGTFSIPGVPTVQGAIDAVASATVGSSFLSGTSRAAEPVPGAVTNLGTTVLQQRIGCVTGNLHYFVDRCNPTDRGPVTDRLDLIDQGGARVAELTPDLSGRFCADLRRNQPYFLLKKDYVDCTGQVVGCRAVLELTDPSSTNICSAGTSSCQDLGDISFFCGSS
ncbi:MAG TPA: Ig-like domain-containing protein, partial [Thermoanaerobaculia bacterium]|nr:Ig-like domain-containing protein [Thermoanaerobaculia bacterium]